MRSEGVEKKNEEIAEGVMTCSCCNRTLKNASEAIHSRRSVMCVSCYESLINPFPKCCSGSALI